MRLGSGGVLLSHYSPLKVAENFHLLEALAPGRIDCGIGRGSGAHDEAEAALATGNGGLPYDQRVADLLTFLDGGFPPEHRFASVVAAPAVARAPEPWLLGSTGTSAALAAACGIPFAYAHFIKGDGVEHTAAYRAAYQPSERFPQPRTAICVAAYCSPDPRERDDYLATLCLRRARMQLEHDALPPTPAEARAHVPSAAEQRSMEATVRLALVTSPDDVRARLGELAARHGADEALIVSVTPDYSTRTRSYEAIARAFGLTQ
jgi:luciferase family oxidoreductase group 1